MSRLTALLRQFTYRADAVERKRIAPQRTVIISKDNKAFDDCVILSKESFDPDAVFLEDIVDDEVLPCLTLEVDGLTTSSEGRHGRFELRPDDVAANEPIAPDTVLPNATLGSDQLEVYGWESSWWRKIKGYLGL